jgi:hypothetical protein
MDLKVQTMRFQLSWLKSSAILIINFFNVLILIFAIVSWELIIILHKTSMKSFNNGSRAWLYL